MTHLSKFALACGMLAAAVPCAWAAGDVLAFPGAEGFGRFAEGGRYGATGTGTAQIYHVTNLNDSGAGSFRDAVSQKGRIIVFDVSGTINLKSALVVQGRNTILGQTAPGEGVQVYGNRVSFSGADELIVRHMRFRMGHSGDSGKDACGVANGENMIFDHVSALWGKDENFSINWDNKGKEPRNITIQNSIIGQGLQPHSCGGLIQTNGGVTLYRNLYIENKTRNPKVKGINQFVNNVLYNWGNAAAYNMGGDSEGTSWAEITGNYFVRGPWKSAARPFVGGNNKFHFYGNDNFYDSNLDGKLNGSEITAQNYADWGGDLVADMNVINAGMASQTTGSEKSFPEIAGRQSAEEAIKWVLANAGASLPAHDEVDRYLLDELASFGTFGTTDGISSENLLPHKGTGTLFGGFKPKDTDNDGIPDEWEIANGLDPNDPADAVKLTPDGYTNIEKYVFTIDAPYPFVKNPTALKASKIEKNAITVTWQDNSDNETGFVIEISTDATNFTEAGRTEADATSFTASGLADNTVYYFRVKAIGADGIESAYSPVLKSLTVDEPFAPKACVPVSPANGAKMRILDARLTWTNSTEDYFGDVTYSVYLGTQASDLAEMTSGLTETSYTPAGLQVDMTYYWRVDATNDVGTTEGPVNSFTVIDGGTLFYTDFRTQPIEFANSEVGIATQANAEMDLIAAGKTDEFEFGNLVIGTAGGRVHTFPGRTNEGVTAEDAGATKGSIGFVGKNGNVNKSYIKVRDIEGPWTITVWSYNSDGKAYSFKFSMADYADGREENTELLTTFAVNTTAKKVTKHTYTYTNDTEGKTLIITPVSSSVGIDFNDILIEKFVPGEVEPLVLSSGKLVNDIAYTDGSVALTFNQNITLNPADVTVDGVHQHENISLSASGKTLTVNYEALDINSTYTIGIPLGTVEALTGEEWTGDIVLKTSDFPASKKAGDTHWGKAKSTLPYDMAPFNSYVGIATVGNHTQTQDNDFPHWAHSGGGVTASAVSFKRVNKDDKVMAYFDGEPKNLYIELDCASGSKGSIMVQETRNADITPGYRTMRVFTEADLPFKGELELHPETRFIKVIQKTYTSGEFILKALIISDSEGNYSGLDAVSADNLEPAEYYNLQGLRVTNPGPGIYIVRRGSATTKALIK